MTNDPKTLIQQLTNRDRTRLASYRASLNFYNGLQWKDGSSSQSTVDAPWQNDETAPNYPWIRRLTLNYAKALIDKITSYLMNGLNFSVEALDETQAAQEMAKRAEEALYRVQARNHLDLLDFDTELDTAVLGDGCYKVLWDPQLGDVRISAPDIQGVYAWWLGDDVSRVWRVASRYVLSPDEIQMLHGHTTTKNTVVTEIWTEKGFELWAGTDRIRVSKNPYGFIPFVIFPNLREPKKFLGVSDLNAVVQPARELNRAMSQLSRILELSGNPIAVLENVDKADDIAVQPGAVWEIPEKAKAYLLDLLQGGGVQLHINYIDLIYRSIHDLSETPRTSFGDNTRALSGVALEMELHPLLQKVRRKRLIRTAAYQKRVDMILRLLAANPSKEGLPASFDARRIRTRLIWSDVLPQDHQRLVEEEARLVEKGIHSRERAADNLGIENPGIEFTKWLDEQRRIGALAGQIETEPPAGEEGRPPTS